MEGFNTFSNHWILPGKWNEKSNNALINAYRHSNNTLTIY